MHAVPRQEDFAVEHQIFWMLVNKACKRTDVGRVYLAIQTAIAFGRNEVDIGWLTGAMMAEGRASMDASGESIGASGLAYFYWLYEVELVAIGDADSHPYHFRRRCDGAQVVARLRTAETPKSLQFQQEYEREKRRLEKKRETFLAAYRWYSTAELFDRYRAAVVAEAEVS